MRRLVVCLDGTGASPTKLEEGRRGYDLFKPSNPLKIYRGVMPCDSKGISQISFYDAGIGTTGTKVGKAKAQIEGTGFGKNVQDAYRFLVGNYVRGDKIFLFGFSRGAAEARSLCRFIDWCGGLLRKSDAYYIPEFFGYYCKTMAKPGAAAKLRRGEGRPRGEPIPMGRPRPVKIEFLGVFDTVLALGYSAARLLLRPKDASAKKNRFHVGDTVPVIVKTARQALAIDERRRSFFPSIWTKRASRRQSLEQRWFAGVHTNVGGGYGRDGLANCALQWMVHEAAAAGLQFDKPFLAHYKAWSGDKLYNSYTKEFKLAGKKYRTFDLTGKGGQVVDPSVFELIKHSAGRKKPYRPRNLLRLLKKNPGLMDDLKPATRKRIASLL